MKSTRDRNIMGCWDYLFSSVLGLILFWGAGLVWAEIPPAKPVVNSAKVAPTMITSTSTQKIEEQYNNAKIAFFTAQDYTRTTRLLQDLLRTTPGHVEANYLLALAYEKIERLPEAITYYQQTLRYQPHHGEAHLGLCSVFYVQGDFERARQACLDAVKESPQNPKPHHFLTYIYLELGDTKRSLEAQKTGHRLAESANTPPRP